MLPGSAFLLAFLFTSAPSKPGRINLEIVDKSQSFLQFYAAASKPGIDEAKRWALWQKMYHFAAVPPTPEGERMARSMLDQAWTRYAAALPVIRSGVAAIQPPPKQSLDEVCQLLGVDVPIHVRLIAAVGDFDGNAYTFSDRDGVPTTAAEIEDPDTGMLLTHEFTHAVEAEQAHLSLDWKRSIAHTIFVEGLAMRVVQHLHPGRKPEDYVGEFSPHWFMKSMGERKKILTDIYPHLSASDPDTVMRYTMGKCSLGIEREAYFAGWLVIGDLLNHGWTFPRLARVTDDQMVTLVGDSLQRMLKDN